jgi:hypothetical protein
VIGRGATDDAAADHNNISVGWKCVNHRDSNLVS